MSDDAPVEADDFTAHASSCSRCGRPAAPGGYGPGRHQRIGACPAGWKAGDQGKPAGAPTSNLLAGQAPGR
ncbi:hypothetical protein ACRAWD_25330 [Caulobacter segnis]